MPKLSAWCCMSEPRLPNFFIAGAPKAGTTSLYHALRQHPQIYMSPVKEPSFFSHEARPENFSSPLREKLIARMGTLQEKLREDALHANKVPGVITRWDDYLQLFRKATDERAIGEGSVCYLWSSTAAREIAAVNPKAKTILILRNPVDRAFSQYLHYLSDGYHPHSFRAHIEASLQPHDAMNPYNPFLQLGMYGQQLERYLQFFPREQVRIWLYDETMSEPAKFLREVLTFLEVDPSFTPDRSRRYHQMEIPRAIGFTQQLRKTWLWRACRACVPHHSRTAVKKLVFKPYGAMAMSHEDRRFLIAHYRQDIARLEGLIHRDLSSWLH